MNDPAPSTGPEPESRPAPSPWLPGPAGDGRRAAGLDDMLRAPVRPPRGWAAWRALLPGPRGALLQVVAALALVWVGFTSIHVLAPDEGGTVSTLGRYDHAIGPGLSLTWPWPLQAVRVQGARADLIEVPASGGENLLLTGDGYLVNLAWRLRYHVADPARFARVAHADAALRGAGAAAVREGLGAIDLIGLMGPARRDEFERAARARAQAGADSWGLGVRVESLELTKVAIPARLADSWTRVKAAQDEVARLDDQTEAYARELNARAEAEAGAFNADLAQYRAAPALTRRRLYYDMMDTVLARNPKVIGGTGALTLPAPKKPAGGGQP